MKSSSAGFNKNRPLIYYLGEKMGIDAHSARYLQNVKNKRGNFNETVTIGRQGIHLTNYQKKKLFGNDYQMKDWKDDLFCENLLTDLFGATSVDSIDASSYENASIIHDMNYPIAAQKQYDTVLDIGTAEHVFDTLTYMNNISKLCKPGGKIIHIIPANNYCNHGFYQFSPCFWLDFYKKADIKVSEMYFASPASTRWWHQIDLDQIEAANSIRTRSEYLLMLTAQKSGETKPVPAPNQGYYNSNRWVNSNSQRATPTKENIKYVLSEIGILGPARLALSLVGLGGESIPGTKINAKRLVNEQH